MLTLVSIAWLKASLSAVILDEIPARSGAPRVYVSNHTSPLDGAVANLILARTASIWFQISNALLLKRYGWFYGSAFIPIRRRALDAAIDVKGIRSMIRDGSADNAYWYYPEGGYRSSFDREASRRSALKNIVRGANVELVAVGIRYDVYQTARPTVTIAFESVGSETTLTGAVEDAIERALNKARTIFLEQLKDAPRTFRNYSR